MIYYIVVCKGINDKQHGICLADDYKTPFITDVLQVAVDHAKQLQEEHKNSPEKPVYDVLRCE